MPKYDFLNLSPIDFEELTRDLLQEHLGIFLESFKEGKDKGIDLRYSKNDNNTIIVQCKRYSHINDLKKNLKLEVKKVKLLSPKKYIIVTSVNLTVQQKKDIQTIFSDYKIYQKNILGLKDINNLLGKFPEIEKAHFKLWLNSTAVLERLLHSNLYNTADFEKEKIIKEIKIYVPNESNKEATEIINKYNYVIISGIPGIGKTTLAKMMLYRYLLDNWEIITISGDIDEGIQLYQLEKKQVFYYDDFLGTNFLRDGLNKNEDKRITRFIERISQSKDKKLILTTREYILKQAEQFYESLNDKSLEIGKCIVDLEKYNKLIKSYIFYNHLFFSDLTYDYISAIVTNNNYFRIINHPNYNPRLIQYLTSKILIGKIEPDKYYNYFVENLANPKQIWDHTFCSQISTISRFLLIVFISMGEPVFSEDLYKGLRHFLRQNNEFNAINIDDFEYKHALKECEKTFLSIEKGRKGEIIRFLNPSIKDFLIHYINNSPEIIIQILKSALFFNQLLSVFTFSADGNKVQLNTDARRLFIEKINDMIADGKISMLDQLYSRSDFAFYWDRAENSLINRMHKIAIFFRFQIPQEVLNIMIVMLPRIDILKEVENENALGKYFDLVELLKDEVEINGGTIIKNIFEKEMLFTFTGVNHIRKFKDIFPTEYSLYIQDNEEIVENSIYEILQGEYSNIEYNQDKGNIEEFLNEISGIYNDFNISIYDFRDRAESLLRDLEDNNDESNEIKEYIAPQRIKLKEEDEIIMDMFATLLQTRVKD